MDVHLGKLAAEQVEVVTVEIDGPQYHRFRDEDARKTARWRKAGFDVRRVPSGTV